MVQGVLFVISCHATNLGGKRNERNVPSRHFFDQAPVTTPTNRAQTL